MGFWSNASNTNPMVRDGIDWTHVPGPEGEAMRRQLRSELRNRIRGEQHFKEQQRQKRVARQQQERADYSKAVKNADRRIARDRDKAIRDEYQRLQAKRGR